MSSVVSALAVATEWLVCIMGLMVRVTVWLLCGQTWQLPALALQKAHRKWPLGRASEHRTALPHHSYCTQTWWKRRDAELSYRRRRRLKVKKKKTWLHAQSLNLPPTRCWGPVLLAGWSQSRLAAQRVYHEAPLNTGEPYVSTTHPHTECVCGN